MHNQNHKHIHFIGIAGSAIAPIAVMMANRGYKVTGSDDNVFEPALSLLNSNGIEWYEGAKPEMIDDADLVIIGGGVMMKGAEHPEFLRAKELGKQIEGYAYIVQQALIKEQSIVVAGSYGKTTTTGLIAWILEQAGEDPSFMMGGKPINFDSGVKYSESSNYSVIEGDEYVSVFGFDMEPRFVHYKPKYAIISSLEWDHINVYKTEESYIEAFIKLADLVRNNSGKIYLSTAGQNNEVILEKYSELVTTYGLEDGENKLQVRPDYGAADIRFNETSTTFNAYFKGQRLGEFETTMIGLHSVDNCIAAIALTHSLGIDLAKIKEAIKTYKGVKRRQELRGISKSGSPVIEDFAHSPVKVRSTIKAIKTRYPNHKMVCIYNPRLSSREDRRTLEQHQGAFDGADMVIIPKIEVKRSTAKADRIYGKDIVIAIASEKSPAQYMPLTEHIENYILEKCDENTVIVFMSASGWNGLIERVLR